MTKPCCLRSIAACLLALGAMTGAVAQDYPARTIRIVVQVAPGNGLDVVTRLLAPEMTKSLGKGVAVENMPAAGGIVAYRHVAKQAPPDGYTVLGTVTTSMTIPVFFKDPGFDLRKDFVPITQSVEGPLVLVTPQGTPWGGFNEMIAYARGNPGKLNHANPGAGNANILFMEAIRQKYGVQIVDVAYGTNSVAFLQALVANEVQLAFVGERGILSLYKDKKVRPLAVSGSRRLASMPEASSFEELGLPGIDGVGMMYLAAAGTPRPIIDRLNAAIVQALNTPSVKESLGKLSYTVVGSSPDVLAAKIAEQTARYIELGRKAGIVAQ